jgi:multiple sugar transport system substrate-binding protein
VLETFDEKQIRAEEFYPQFLNAFKGSDGKIYGVPKDYSTLALYLNTDMLQKAGYRISDVPGDFNGLMKFARKLQTKLPKGSAAMLIEKDLARHLSAMEAFGITIIDAAGKAHLSNNPSLIDYLGQLINGHAGQYLLSAKEDLGADWAGSAFGTQKAVMMMEGNWVVPALKKDYPDVRFISREMPTVNGHKQTMAFVVGYAVARGAKNKAGGMQFARFMTDQGMGQWARESGMLPTRKKVEEEISAKTNPEMAAHVLGASYATVWSRGDSLPIINTNFGNQFLAAFNGSKPLATALAIAEKTSNKEIERQR